jgi:hypothetical protein
MSVAVTIGLIILAAFVAITLSLKSSVIAISNYVDLDKASRQTLDNLSRDIRNAATVGSTSSAISLSLTNNYSGTNIITYAWDGSSNVTRTVTSSTGVIVENPVVMLKNCDYLAFSYFVRVPTNGLQFISTTNVISTNQVKLVSVSWRCSRSILGSKLNTESVQTANVVMRN